MLKKTQIVMFILGALTLGTGALGLSLLATNCAQGGGGESSPKAQPSVPDPKPGPSPKPATPGLKPGSDLGPYPPEPSPRPFRVSLGMPTAFTKNTNINATNTYLGGKLKASWDQLQYKVFDHIEGKEGAFKTLKNKASKADLLAGGTYASDEPLTKVAKTLGSTFWLSDINWDGAINSLKTKNSDWYNGKEPDKLSPEKAQKLRSFLEGMRDTVSAFKRSGDGTTEMNDLKSHTTYLYEDQKTGTKHIVGIYRPLKEQQASPEFNYAKVEFAADNNIPKTSFFSYNVTVSPLNEGGEGKGAELSRTQNPSFAITRFVLGPHKMAWELKGKGAARYIPPASLVATGKKPGQKEGVVNLSSNPNDVLKLLNSAPSIGGASTEHPFKRALEGAFSTEGLEYTAKLPYLRHDSKDSFTLLLVSKNTEQKLSEGDGARLKAVLDPKNPHSKLVTYLSNKDGVGTDKTGALSRVLADRIPNTANEGIDSALTQLAFITTLHPLLALLKYGGFGSTLGTSIYIGGSSFYVIDGFWPYKGASEIGRLLIIPGDSMNTPMLMVFTAKEGGTDPNPKTYVSVFPGLGMSGAIIFSPDITLGGKSSSMPEPGLVGAPTLSFDNNADQQKGFRMVAIEKGTDGKMSFLGRVEIKLSEEEALIDYLSNLGHENYLFTKSPMGVRLKKGAANWRDWEALGSDYMESKVYAASIKNISKGLNES